MPASKSREKTPGGRLPFGDRLLDGAAGEFACSRVSGMSLDDDGISGGEGGGGVSACHGEGEGEVACAKDGDRADGAEHRAEIAARERLAVGHRFVDAEVCPGAFFKDFGEELELARGPAEFSIETGKGQASFEMGAFDQGRAGGGQLIRDAPEEGGAIRSAYGCIDGERRPRPGWRRAPDRLTRRGKKGGSNSTPVAGLTPAEGLAFT